MTVLSFDSALFAQEFFCAEPFLAHRNGSENCWASFSGGDHKSLCISHEGWLKWLKQTHVSSLCGNWKGTWRAYSPLVNHSWHTESFRKPVFYRYFVKDLPMIVSYSTPVLAPSVLNKIKNKTERVREKISEFYRAKDTFGILRKLFLNEESSGHATSFFWFLGFVHVFTVTGIHLLYFAVMLNAFLGWLFRFSGVSVSVGLFLSRTLTFVSWFLIWTLSGMRAGMLRPWIVLLVRALAKGFGFEWRTYSPLLISLCLDAILFLRSHDGVSSRIHYALAVGGSLMVGFTDRNLKWCHVKLALGSWVLVALVDIFESGLVCLATPLLSLLTFHLFVFFIFPLQIFACLLYSLHFLSLAKLIFSFSAIVVTKSLIFLMSWILSLPFLWVIPFWAFGFGILSAALSFFFFKFRLKQYSVGIVVLLLVRFLVPSFGKSTDFATQVEQLDVGQGDAALVKKNSGRERGLPEIGFIDVGSQKAISTDAWIKLFAKREITHIDWIALSHLDEDHVGGVFRLASVVPIGCVATSIELLNTPTGVSFLKKVKRFPVSVGDWKSGCFPFPVSVVSHSKKNARNDQMSVFWIPLQNSYYFSMGDADCEQEKKALSWVRKYYLKKEFPVLLKISHHGSKYSTDLSVLSELKPHFCFISSGLGNRYGHPHPRVLNLLNSLGIPSHRTDEQGSLNSRDLK